LASLFAWRATRAHCVESNDAVVARRREQEINADEVSRSVERDVAPVDPERSGGQHRVWPAKEGSKITRSTGSALENRARSEPGSPSVVPVTTGTGAVAAGTARANRSGMNFTKARKPTAKRRHVTFDDGREENR
jgi:hypothetical protein